MPESTATMYSGKAQSLPAKRLMATPDKAKTGARLSNTQNEVLGMSKAPMAKPIEGISHNFIRAKAEEAYQVTDSNAISTAIGTFMRNNWPRYCGIFSEADLQTCLDAEDILGQVLENKNSDHQQDPVFTGVPTKSELEEVARSMPRGKRFDGSVSLRVLKQWDTIPQTLAIEDAMITVASGRSRACIRKTMFLFDHRLPGLLPTRDVLPSSRKDWSIHKGQRHHDTMQGSLT